MFPIESDNLTSGLTRRSCLWLSELCWTLKESAGRSESLSLSHTNVNHLDGCIVIKALQIHIFGEQLFQVWTQPCWHWRTVNMSFKIQQTDKSVAFGPHCVVCETLKKRWIAGYIKLFFGPKAGYRQRLGTSSFKVFSNGEMLSRRVKGNVRRESKWGVMS